MKIKCKNVKYGTDYLTANKEYEVVEEYVIGSIKYLEIVDDEGQVVCTLLSNKHKCPHTDSFWEIVE